VRSKGTARPGDISELNKRLYSCTVAERFIHDHGQMMAGEASLDAIVIGTGPWRLRAALEGV